MARLSERDASIWARVAGRAAVEIEPRLNDRVLGNRVLAGPEGMRPIPIGPGLARARRAARRLSQRSAVLVRTDVRSFYPSVTPSALFRALTGYGVERDVAAEAAELLEGWGSEGYAGLPIGPPGSTVLANAILAQVDEEIAPLRFLRWVDDYLIGRRTEGQAAEVLERLDVALESVGLERSAPKTKVCGGGRPFSWLGTSGAAGPSQ